MSRDVRTLMEAATSEPTIQLDEKRLVAQALRQRKIVRAATLSAGVVAVVVVVVGVAGLGAGTSPFEVIDQPPADAPAGPTTGDGGHAAEGAWTRATNGGEVFGGPGDQVALGIAGGPRGLVAVGVDEGRTDINEDDTATVWRSREGASWQRAVGFRDAAMTDVVWFEPGGMFVAVGSRVSNGAVWASEDGEDWQQTATIDHQPAGGISLWAVAATKTGLVAVGQEWLGEGHAIPTAWASTDAKTWTRADLDTAPADGEATMTDVADTGSGLIAVGHLRANTETEPTVWVSSDGGSWRAVASAETFGSDVSLTAVASDEERTTVVGEVGSTESRMWTSTDGGHSWELIDLGSLATDALTINDLAFTAHGWVAVGGEISPDASQSSTVVLISEDGLIWQHDTPEPQRRHPDGGTGAVMRAVTPVPGGLAAVGYQGQTCVLRYAGCDLDAVVWTSARNGDD